MSGNISENTVYNSHKICGEVEFHAIIKETKMISQLKVRNALSSTTFLPKRLTGACVLLGAMLLVLNAVGTDSLTAEQKRSDDNNENKMNNCANHAQIFNQSQMTQSRPIAFVANVRGNCWYEHFNQNDVDRMMSNPFIHQAGSDLPNVLKKIANYSLQLTQRLRAGSNVRLRCLPHFNIIGQSKCGSTDLYKRLTRHPQILSGLLKEPMWWTYGENANFDDYVALNDVAALQIENEMEANNCSSRTALGEGSVTMLLTMLFRRKGSIYGLRQTADDVDTPHFVKWLVPDSKFIVIMRNPIDRLYSDYLYFSAPKRLSQEDFHKCTLHTLEVYKECRQAYGDIYCLDHFKPNSTLKLNLHRGLYSVGLKLWLKAFDREKFVFLQMEDYSRNMAQNLNNVFEFLDLDTKLTSEQTEAILKHEINNKLDESRNIGKMWDSTRQILQEFHQPYNEELAELIQDKRFLWQ